MYLISLRPHCLHLVGRDINSKTVALGTNRPSKKSRRTQFCYLVVDVQLIWLLPSDHNPTPQNQDRILQHMELKWCMSL